MKVRPIYWLLLLVFPALLACNLSTLASGSTPAVPEKTMPTQNTKGTQPASLPKLETQARDVVSAFFTALQNDPTGKLATGFFGPKLQQVVSGGKPVNQLLGVQSTLPKYQLAAVSFSPDASLASVDVTLMYQKPANYRIGLVRAGETWKIDSILSLEGSAYYPATPEQVVQTFLQSYQEAPSQMEQYLSAKRLTMLPPGGAVGMLNINGSMEGMMIQSAAVNPDPPSATLSVAIRVGGKDVMRVFSLSKEKDQWKIDNIDPE
jgi:hypothetical protein